MNRRNFLTHIGMASGLTTLGGVFGATANANPRFADKLRTAHIGVGGKGEDDLNIIGGLPNVEVVAICDVDQNRSAGSFKRHEKAAKYDNYRQLFDAQAKNIDAVIVSTPDHLHASIAIAAMQLGKHVYCQKPLARTVWEVRKMHDAARKHKVVTQMGTQAHPTYAPTVEAIKAGLIGKVTEAHVVTDRPIWPQGHMSRPPAMPIPSSLNWDMWLGPMEKRDFNSAYCPFVWRGWWDFGTGALGDMACHLMDGPYWALDLGLPTKVSAECDARLLDSPPKWSVITYEFAARKDQPPVKLVWYDGGKRPSADLLGGEPLENGTLFVGDKGKLLVEHSKKPRLIPDANVKMPMPTIPRYDNHYKQWVDACLGLDKTASNFDYACPMVEGMLLGNVAIRTGKIIEYNPRTMKAKGCPEADEFIKPQFRSGWKI